MIRRKVWVREDRNGRPVKVALTPRGVGEADEYGNRPVVYVPASEVDDAVQRERETIAAEIRAKLAILGIDPKGLVMKGKSE